MARYPPGVGSARYGRGSTTKKAAPFRPYYPPTNWRPPGLPVWNPGSNPAIRARVGRAAGALAPLSAPPAFPSTGPAGGTPPPGYGDLLAQLLAGLGGAGGGLPPEEGLAQARRALVQYGGVPAGLSGLHNLAGAFDSGTSALARENTNTGISLLARINQAHTDQNRYIQNRLAAHGILESGETGFQLGREQTNYTRAQADSASKLLDYLSGINSGISQYLQWQEMMDALSRAQAGFGAGTIGADGSVATTAPPAPPPAPPIYGSYSSGTYYPYLRQRVGKRNVYY